MKKIKLTEKINVNGKIRQMALWECTKCGLQKEARADMKCTTELCRKCSSTSHGYEGKKVYNTWLNIKARCYNPKNNRYSSYGARGIKVCQEWLVAENFIAWAYANGFNAKEGERNIQFTIDRIDVNKDYSPDNCRIVPIEVQHYNKQILSVANTSGYVGVSKKGNRFVADITYRGKKVFYKYFLTIEEAVKARNKFIVDNNLPHKLNATVEQIQEVLRVVKGE